MKKLMIATMTAGLAVGAFATYEPITQLKTCNLGFETDTVDQAYEFDSDEAPNWVNIDEKNTVKAYETAPAADNKKYLHLDTEGEDVYRAFDDATNWGAGTTNAMTMGNALWIDTKVKFTASESAPALDAGAKFALWMEEIEGETESTYKLHALCGSIDAGGVATVTDVVLDAEVSPANWYRLVIRPDWDSEAQFGFFTVTLDDQPLAAAAGTVLVEDPTGFTSANQALIAAGKLFPSRVASTEAADKIVAVGFNGTGDIDDFKVRDDDPYYVYVESVTLNVTATNVVVGQTFQLTATVSPVDATVQTVTWTSDNASVAEVDTETGLVTCKAVGEATITADCDGETATCAVTVTAGSIDVVVPTSDKWTATVDPAFGKVGDTITVTYTANGGYYFGNNQSTMTATGTLQADGSIAFESEPETDTKPFKGQGTEADPFLIEVVDDLKKLDSLVDGGDTFAGKYFKQMADINFDGVSDWSGIGTVGGEGKTFSGVYDGDNKKITGITTTSTVNYSGILFNNVDNAEIKNLTVDVYADASGGFSAFGGANATVFSNVVVKGTILGTHHCGGFTCFGQWTDQMSTYIDCTNEATVASSKSAGGFCGKPQTGATFIRCVNKGTIGAEGKMGSDGGLGGFCSGVDPYGHFTDCTNEGVVLGSFGQFGSSAPTSIAGTMTARDDQFAATAVFDGLNFATVADNVATLISNDQVVVGGAYKVMSPIATIPVTLDTVGQTIAFDDALNTAFDATITADGVAVTTNIVGTVTTYTAIEAPTPGEDWPVDPTVTEGSDATATFPNLPAAFKGADAGLVAAWAKGKGGVAYADMATASIDAFLLDCAANEVETEAAKFKIISIDNVGGEWIVKVTGEKTEGENYTVNAKVEIFDVTSTIDSETAVATGAKGFFKAKLVPFIVTK